MKLLEQLTWSNKLSEETIKLIEQNILASKDKQERMSSEELKP